MKKRSSIIKITIIGVITIIGLVMSFCTFHFGLTTLKSYASAIELGLDLKGGIYAVYEMDSTEDTTNLSSRMEGTRSRLEKLLGDKGFTEATVVREGNTRLRVEVPDRDDPGEIFDIIGKPAELTFELQKDDGTTETVFTGKNVITAEARHQQGSSTSAAEWVVALKLDSVGTEAFAKATSSENIGKRISIYTTVEGNKSEISSPTIQSTITNGEAIITGMGTYENATNLADQITSGQFEVKLSLLECSTVSPTLGEQALFYGVIAGVVGILLVMAFLIWRYRLLGVVASMALLLYTSLVLLFLAILPWVQLTLPGIAGVILSIGMAVDANVVIFERIKDEYRNGKSMLAALHAGFKKSTKAIIDSNVTTIIAAVVLLIFGTGSVRGFAITLLVGIVLSLFSALLITRLLSKSFMDLLPDRAGLFGLKRGKNYDEAKANAVAEDEEAPEAEEFNMPSGEVANETV